MPVLGENQEKESLNTKRASWGCPLILVFRFRFSPANAGSTGMTFYIAILSELQGKATNDLRNL